MLKTRNRIDQLIHEYKATNCESNILLIYQSLDSLILEMGICKYFEDVCIYLSNVCIGERYYMSFIIEEMDKMIYRHKNENLNYAGIGFVMKISNTFDSSEKIDFRNMCIRNVDENETCQNVKMVNKCGCFMHLNKSGYEEQEFELVDVHKSINTDSDNIVQINDKNNLMHINEFMEYERRQPEFKKFYNQVVRNSVEPKYYRIYETYYRCLFVALKPVFEYEKRTCLNFVVHMATKTDLNMIDDVIEHYSIDLSEQIKLHIYKVTILKEKNKDITDTIKTIKEKIELIWTTDKKFSLLKIYLNFLSVHYDQDICDKLTAFVFSSDDIIWKEFTHNIHILYENKDLRIQEYILSILQMIISNHGYAKEQLLYNEQFFKGTSEVDPGLKDIFLEKFVNVMDQLTNDKNSKVNSFETLLDIFLYITENMKTKAVKKIFLHLMKSKILLDYELAACVFLEQLFERYIQLFCDEIARNEPDRFRIFTNNNEDAEMKDSNLDFNKLMTFDNNLNYIEAKLKNFSIDDKKDATELDMIISRFDYLENICINDYKNILHEFIFLFTPRDWLIMLFLENLKVIFLLDDTKREEFTEIILSTNHTFRIELNIIIFAIHNAELNGQLIDSEFMINIGIVFNDKYRLSREIREKLMNNFSKKMIDRYATSKYFYNRMLCKNVLEHFFKE